MTPGPVFAVAIAKGSKDKAAGFLISLGHGIVEFPLMFLIYFGFAEFLSSSMAQKIIGVARRSDIDIHGCSNTQDTERGQHKAFALQTRLDCFRNSRD